jgi:HEPN domain-containing protein
MNEFAKHKIAFAVAFLAALFSISPLIKEVGERGFHFFGIFLSINYLYYAAACIFTLSVYAFGIQFLTEKGINWAAKAGNAFYALALTTPVIYLALFISAKTLEVLGKNLSILVINVITGVIGALLGALGTMFIYIFQRRLAEREKNATTEQLSKEETLFMKRAQELIRSKHYDLAVVEAFKAIEVSAKKVLFEQGRYFQPNKWLSTISNSEILPKELIQGLNRIREVRNVAAHGVEPVSSETAKEIIPLAARIVATLSSQQVIT